MTAMLARPLPIRYDSLMRPNTPLHDRTVTNSSQDHAYNRNHATPGLYEKKVGSDASYTKPSAVVNGHTVPTSRLAYVPGKRRRRDVSRENRVPAPQQNSYLATRHQVVAAVGRHKINSSEEDVNPFIDPDTEWNVPPRPSHANTASSPLPVSDDSLRLQADSAQHDDEAFVYTPQDATTRIPHATGRLEQMPDGERKSPTKPRKPSWKAPGPSPLSQVLGHTSPDRAYSRGLPLIDAMLDNIASGFRPISIRPLPRTLAGKHRGRVAISLLYNFLLKNFLRRIYALDVESPELDFVDGESMEFLLDLQIDLLEGWVTIPSLSSYAISDRPTLGTARRRLMWRSGQTFPRRLEDYERAATKLLARKRAAATLQDGV